MYHVNVNVHLIEASVILINCEIIMIVNVNVKNVTYMKKIMFGMLLHVIVKMENI